MTIKQASNAFEPDRRHFLQAAGVAGMVAAHALPRTSLAQRQTERSLITHSEIPHNAEPELTDLVRSWITPVESFYVRSHAPAPEINESEFELSVEGLVHRPMKISVGQLRDRFPRKTAVATLTCAGNRRSEHSRVKPVKGVAWQAGAIGNASWTGTPLSALLKKAGLKPEAKHVWFAGVDRIDRDSDVISFGGSIPIAKAMTDTSQMPGAMLAYEMNHEKLSPDHGYPLRAVVPGFIGARSVKWLGRIVVSDKPSTNYYVANAYKLVVDGTDDEWASQEPIYQYPINSVTCLPADGTSIKPGKIRVSGYALAEGLPGRTIARVEISTDAGHSWTKARFTSKAAGYCWRLWTADIPVMASTKSLVVRATDSAGVVQPERVAWNLKGYLYNAWHRIAVDIES